MINRISYTQQRKALQMEIASMYQDLQAYKVRDNANLAYAERIEQRINTIMNFLNTADAAIIEAEEQRQEAFSRGIRAAEKKQDEPFDRLNPNQREDYRAWSIHQAQKQFPNLY